MVVTKHAEQLHAFGGHLTLTGRRFGSPRAAGLGTAIQRHHQSLAAQSAIPYAYVLAPEDLGRTYFLTQASAIGQHPGNARPLALRVGSPVGDLLARNGVSAEADELFKTIHSQYRDLLGWQGSGNTVRSADFDVYDSAAHYLLNAHELDAFLGGNTLQASTAEPCVYASGHQHPGAKNTTKRSLEVAASLFEHGARHVTVIDGGLNITALTDSSTPYDGHHRPGVKNVVEMTSAHLFNLMRGLADLIKPPATGELGLQQSDPGPKIDLNDTLVLIHTEFNRSPDPGIDTSGGFASCGREHFPGATVALLIGGPITTRGIAGGIALDGGEANSARAVNAFTPTDVHAAFLLAAGVDPLAAESFTTGDDFSNQINPGGNAYDQEIRSNLKLKVLGDDGGLSSLTL